MCPQSQNKLYLHLDRSAGKYRGTMTVETGSHWQADEVDYWAWIDTSAAAAAGDDDDEHPHAVVSRIKEGTRKRLYEHGDGEVEDREMDKMYKRDYWEDPAYAPLLEFSGLLVARAEAVLCLSERVHRDSEAIVAEWWRERERERRSRADESEPETETAPAAAAGQGHRLFIFCFWRSIVDNLAALLRYFLG